MGAYNATIDSDKKTATGTIVQNTYPLPVTANVANYSQAGPSARLTVFNVPLTLTNSSREQTRNGVLHDKRWHGEGRAPTYGGINRHGHVTISPPGKRRPPFPSRFMRTQRQPWTLDHFPF